MSNYIQNPTLTSVSVKLPNDTTTEVIFYEIHMKVWQDRYWMVRDFNLISDKLTFFADKLCFKVKRRYSEFDKLNDELVKEIPAISKDLLPGKKLQLIGKNSSAFLEQVVTLS